MAKRPTFDPFVAWCRAHGLNVPAKEYRFRGDRKWRFDYAWFMERRNGLLRVAVEVEGGAWTQGRHTRGKGYIADMEKYRRAALDGWIVLRYTPKDLMTPQSLAELKEALLG